MVYRFVVYGAVALVLFSAQAFSLGKVTSIEVRDGEVVLAVETTPGDRYQTQCSSNLVGAVWMNLGSEFVAVSNVTTKSFNPEASTCYVRVVKTGSDGTSEEPPPPDEEPPPPPAS